MEVTDTWRLRAIVCDALVGHVEVVGILHSTRRGNTTDWWRYILYMAFRLANGSRRDLRINE